jgi:hypothetical protein
MKKTKNDPAQQRQPLENLPNRKGSLPVDRVVVAVVGTLRQEGAIGLSDFCRESNLPAPVSMGTGYVRGYVLCILEPVKGMVPTCSIVPRVAGMYARTAECEVYQVDRRVFELLVALERNEGQDGRKFAEVFEPIEVSVKVPGNRKLNRVKAMAFAARKCIAEVKAYRRSGKCKMGRPYRLVDSGSWLDMPNARRTGQ